MLSSCFGPPHSLNDAWQRANSPTDTIMNAKTHRYFDIGHIEQRLEGVEELAERSPLPLLPEKGDLGIERVLIDDGLGDDEMRVLVARGSGRGRDGGGGERGRARLGATRHRGVRAGKDQSCFS